MCGPLAAAGIFHLSSIFFVKNKTISIPLTAAVVLVSVCARVLAEGDRVLCDLYYVLPVRHSPSKTSHDVVRSVTNSRHEIIGTNRRNKLKSTSMM